MLTREVIEARPRCLIPRLRVDETIALGQIGEVEPAPFDAELGKRVHHVDAEAAAFLLALDEHIREIGSVIRIAELARLDNHV